MKPKDIKQGEIWICDLSKDSVDHEQKGVRPVIVISANIRNDNSNNVFVFPITHATKKEQPCHYKLRKSKYPFFTYKENTVLCEEGRSVSKRRLERKIGTIDEADILSILVCKEYVFVEWEKG